MYINQYVLGGVGIPSRTVEAFGTLQGGVVGAPIGAIEAWRAVGAVVRADQLERRAGGSRWAWFWSTRPYV